MGPKPVVINFHTCTVAFLCPWFRRWWWCSLGLAVFQQPDARGPEQQHHWIHRRGQVAKVSLLVPVQLLVMVWLVVLRMMMTLRLLRDLFKHVSGACGTSFNLRCSHSLRSLASFGLIGLWQSFLVQGVQPIKNKSWICVAWPWGWYWAQMNGWIASSTMSTLWTSSWPWTQ